MTQNNQWQVGDRFIYVKNLVDSETVPLGYKGIVQEVTRTAVFCDGYAFEFEEIKKIFTVRG